MSLDKAMDYEIIWNYYKGGSLFYILLFCDFSIYCAIIHLNNIF